MHVKHSIVGQLVYCQMLLLIAGLVLYAIRRTRAAVVVAAAAYAAAMTAWFIRWDNVGHVPMQNMFEVFLTLGVFLLPIGLLARKFTGIASRVDVIGDFVLTLIILFPAAFVFSDLPQKLPPALQSPLFGPHVAVYMFSYALMAKAALQAGAGLWEIFFQDRQLAGEYEQSGYLLVCLGFPFLSLGLFLGSVWGKLAWGDWWGWDPKELWSLACWLMYIFYFHWRHLYGRKLLTANCIWMILGLVFIVITLLWVNLSRIFSGMHNYAA